LPQGLSFAEKRSIDFVHFRGKGVKLKEAKIVGESEERAYIIVSPYPSDHHAVVATVTLPVQPKSEMHASDSDARER